MTLGTNPNYTVTKVDAALTVNPAVATVTANAKSKTYGDDNPALDAVVAGAVNGDTLAYSLATTAVKTSGVGSYPITVTPGHQPELHGHQGRRDADGQPGGGHGDGQRQEQDLRRRQPTLDAAVAGTVDGDTLDYSLATRRRRPRASAATRSR